MDFYYRLIENDNFCITSYKGNAKHIVIPDHINVTILFDDLFKGHTEITSIKIPDSITDIGGFVFDGCWNLKEIILPPNLNNMWQYAMCRCGIESITIPGTINSVVPFTFNQCKDLKEVRFCEGTTNICSWAFKDCSALQDVYLPKSLTSISEHAFDGCEHVVFHTID